MSFTQQGESLNYLIYYRACPSINYYSQSTLSNMNSFPLTSPTIGQTYTNTYTIASSDLNSANLQYICFIF